MGELTAISCTFVFAYLVGAIPFGYLVGRWRGVDIFSHGSGNIGATNVGRVLGRRFGVLVFLLDFAKGTLPVAAAGGLESAQGGTYGTLPPGLLPVAAGLAAFLGHLFPIYLRFRGGKGVATGAGVVAVLLPGPTIAAVVVWLAVLCATRYASLASLAGAAALCLFRLAMTPDPFGTASATLTGFCLVAAGLVFVRHRANIGRIVEGNENRIKESAGMLQLTKIIHLFALALWFGGGVFFTFVVALLLFQTFESLGSVPTADRPAWLPLPSEFHKEDGSKLAGVAVSPIFPVYFALQGICGLLALATALGWNRAAAHRRLSLLRSWLLGLAMVGVLVGWPLLHKVSELRMARYSTDAQIAEAARAAFGHWHLASLLLNMLTLAFVAGALVLAAWMPAAAPKEEPSLLPAGKAHAS